MAALINTFRKPTDNGEKEKKEKKEKKENKPKSDSKVKNKEEKEDKEHLNFNLIAFLKDPRFIRVIGVFLILISAYILIAFISFLFTWKADNDLVSNSYLSLIANRDVIADNWLGRLGAIIAHQFMQKWFGVSSFLFVLLFFISGLKLFLNITLISITKTFKFSMFLLIWVSLTLGCIFITPNFLYLGGAFGYFGNVWLSGIVGKIGTVLLIIAGYAGFMILAFNATFNWINEITHLRKQKNKETIDNSKEEDDESVISNTWKNAYTNENVISDEELDDSDIEPFKEEEPKIITKVKEEKKTKKIELEITESPVNTPITPVNTNIEEIIVEAETVKLEPDPLLDFELKTKSTIEFTIENPVVSVNLTPEEAVEKTIEELVMEQGDFDPTAELPKFKFPTIDFLKEYSINTVVVQKEELEANKNKIVETLGNYGIGIDKIKATIGPTVTLYEIVPEKGIRIQKIKNLEDDIALSLSALGIRIIAPIPGKGTIGIEVPNLNPEIVSMRSIIESEKFQNSTFDLPIALGKTISNEIYIADLAKMPHLLVAGATGQGKSVGLNAILTSLLYKKHPAYLKFVLVDPKKVELTLFSHIERHYLAKMPDLEEAIITDTHQVVRTLKSLCLEMDNRYNLLKDAGVRNIKEYNAKFISRRLNPKNNHRFLPYIVLIIDEFADLIMTAGREVETPIARLAQLARAIGIHLVIATQRPSVNIITGTIKANFPARLAFRVTSKIDSRTILDSGGADQLIGRGDMLLSTGNDLMRIQCAFIDTPEINDITEYIGGQNGFSTEFLLPDIPEEGAIDMGDTSNGDTDELFDEAARLIVQNQQGSTSLIQRKLKLGYNRAGRIIDELERAGIVGPFEGSKARKVLIQDLSSLEQLLSNREN